MQHATSSSNIRPPGRGGPGEVRLIEVGSQAAGSIAEGRFGAPPGDQLGPPSTVSATETQRQKPRPGHKMGSAACEACRSTPPMPLRQHGCTPGHTRWQWSPVRYARSLVSQSHSYSHSRLGWRRCRWRWRLLNPRGYTGNYSKMYAQPYVAPICRQLTGVAPQPLSLLAPHHPLVLVITPQATANPTPS